MRSAPPGSRHLFLDLVGRLAREGRLGLVVRKTLSLARLGDWSTLREKIRRALVQTGPPAPDAYQRWMVLHEPTPDALCRMRQDAEAMTAAPTFSLLMPTHDVDGALLRRTIDSLLAQCYPHWELHVALVGAPGQPQLRRMLEDYSAREPRLRATVGLPAPDVSTALNAALDRATGEFVGLVDAGDELAPDALYESARLLQETANADVIYSDEDRLSVAGARHRPHFKPDWSPDLFYSTMYTGRLALYRTALVRRVGGFRAAFADAGEYDLVLRLLQHTERVCHIPKVLYHRRPADGAREPRAPDTGRAERAAIDALREHFGRRGVGAEVGRGVLANTYRVRYLLGDKPLVSIVVPTRNAAGLVRRCVQSIRERSTYPNYEIVVVDNQSSDPAAVDYLQALERDGIARVVPYPLPFNFAAVNNFAVRHTRGELLLFLNDDTEVISAEWLEALTEHAVRPGVGAVGARLLYPDGRIQHAGVILGLGDVADHAHKHLPSDDAGYFGRARLIQNFSAVTAACLMTRRRVFDEVGGFDERLGMALNDVDLCLRLREKGYRIVWTPYAELYHRESATRGSYDTAEKRQRLREETEYLRRRWGARLERDPYYSPNLTRDRHDFSPRLA